MNDSDPIETFLAAFPEAKKDGNGWKVRCPAHDDRTPSLSINVGDDGKVLLHCYAGCSLDAILSAKRLETAQLFRANNPALTRRGTTDHKLSGFSSSYLAMRCYELKLGKPVKTWSYHDAAGVVVLEVGRFDLPHGGKEFRPVSIGTDGKWRLKAPETRPIYNLPDVIKAVKAGDTIFVTEGEKAADAVRSLGFVSTTSMNGAKSPKKTDWSPLSGANVVIWRDNDDAGEDYRKVVTEILQALKPPPNIRIIVTGTEKGDDAFDWIEAHGDAAEPEAMRAELGQLVTAAETVKSAVDEIEILWAEDLILKYPGMREPIIDGLLRRGETMNIIAAPKTGKSWMAVSLALTVALGWKWLGRFWTRPGKVLIVDNELHPETTSNRLQQISHAMGIVFEEHKRKVATVNVRGKLTDLNKLAVQLSSPKFGEFSMIILDAWYRFQPAGSDENSNGDVTQLYNTLDSVAAKLDCAFVCIHHTSKGNQSAKGVTDVGAGAGAQSRAAIRTCLSSEMAFRPRTTGNPA